MRRRSSLIGLSCFLVAALAEATFGHAAAQSNAGPAPAAIAPDAVPSLAPADAPTTLPYPAYGTPVPGVQEGVSVPNVPHILSLKGAIDIAVALSPALAAARADVGVTQAEVRLARAGLLPSIGISLGASHSWYGNRVTNTGTLNNVVNNGSFTNQQNNQGSLSLSRLIFDGGRTAAGIRAAKETETSAADTYRRELQTVAYNVATAYYNTMSAERTTQVDVELVRENEVQLALVQAQFRAGTVAHVDVVTAELPVAQARVAVVQAQGNEVAAQAAFANSLGIDANANVRPKDDTPVFQTAGIHTIAIPTYAVAIARAEKLRADLDASSANVRSAQYAVREAKLGLFPTLSGSASQGFTSTSIGGGAYTRATTVGGSFAIPLFDQGQTPANTARAEAQLASEVAAYQSTLLGIQLNVRQTLAQLVSAREAVTESQIALNEGQEVLRSTQAQYRAGVTTLPQLLNSQVSLSQALTSQLSTVYALRQAEQAFLYAVGQNTP